MATRPLDESVAVITGAGGRLGRRMMAAFSEQGAEVAAVERDLEKAALAEEQGAAYYPIDMSDEGEVEDGFRRIAETHGRIDIVVHTVGMWEGRPFLDTSLADWTRVIDTNLTSTFLCFREAIRYMRESDGGRLIAFASGQGITSGAEEQAAYSAAKAGVVRLVETISKEYQADEITAHAIAPSFIRYQDGEQPGVAASELVRLALYLSDPAAGRALNGATLRAFGTLL